MRRQQTNTPLQALVTMNDPTYIEAARALGEQMCGNTDSRAAIITCYRKLTGRKPLPAEVDLLLQLQTLERDKFNLHPQKQKGWLNAGQHKVDKSLDQALLSANTVVASTIMNSDASITRR